MGVEQAQTTTQDQSPPPYQQPPSQPPPHQQYQPPHQPLPHQRYQMPHPPLSYNNPQYQLPYHSTQYLPQYQPPQYNAQYQIQCQPQYQAQYQTQCHNSNGPVIVINNASGPVSPSAAGAPPSNGLYPNFAAKRMNGLGLTMSLVTAVTLCCQTIAVAVVTPYSYGGAYAGFWCGTVFLVATICALVAGREAIHVKIMVALVTALVSAVFSVTLFGLYLDLLVLMIRLSGFYYLTMFTTCVLIILIMSIIQFFLSFAVVHICTTAVCSRKTQAQQATSTAVTRQATTVQRSTDISTITVQQHY